MVPPGFTSWGRQRFLYASTSVESLAIGAFSLPLLGIVALTNAASLATNASSCASSRAEASENPVPPFCTKSCFSRAHCSGVRLCTQTAKPQFSPPTKNVCASRTSRLYTTSCPTASRAPSGADFVTNQFCMTQIGVARPAVHPLYADTKFERQPSQVLMLRSVSATFVHRLIKMITLNDARRLSNEGLEKSGRL